jgi:hypothetical protein
MGLMGDFGLDDLLPEALEDGRANGHLHAEPLGLDGVGFEGQEKAGGQVSAIADEDGGPLLEKSSQDGVGIGDGRMVDEEDADVFTGDLALGLSILPDEQLSEMDR